MPPPRRVAFVLIDGIGDISIPELGNRTPLEAAHTPHLDAIAGPRFAAASHWGTGIPVSPDAWCTYQDFHI